MDLQELVRFRNELVACSTDLVHETVTTELTKILHLMQIQNFTSNEVTRRVAEKYQILQNSLLDFDSTMNVTYQHIEELIHTLEPARFQDSTYRYQERCDALDAEQKAINEDVYVDFVVRRKTAEMKAAELTTFIDKVFSESISISDELQQLIQMRFMAYSDWHYPAVIVRPARKEFIDIMVANDPLYVVDDYPELIEPAKNRFNPTYQRRLRFYTGPEAMALLPDRQLALCMAYNYFDHKPMEVIQRSVQTMYDKLRPGGVMMMTINDCDRPGAILLVDQQSAYYTPGNQIVNFAKNLGFELHFKTSDGPTTWLELKRPGQLESLRGSQTLAKINYK